jgi:hypothetical protein
LLTYDQHGRVYHDFEGFRRAHSAMTKAFHLICVREALEEARRYLAFAMSHPNRDPKLRKTHTSSPETFWQRVDQSAGPGDCWPWMLGLDPHGYGQLSYKGKLWKAHRLAITLATGVNLPKSINGERAVVLHSCDNPGCCNPKHLTLGTQSENVRDMMAKGRHRTQPQWGSKNGASKLSAPVGLDRRARRASGVEIAIISRQFALSYDYTQKILSGKKWPHVN